MNDEPLSQSEIILYQTEDGRTRVQCRFVNETIWLTRAQRRMADLFQIGVETVNHHLRAAFAEGELAAGATIRRYRIVQTEGGRHISCAVDSDFEKAAKELKKLPKPQKPKRPKP